jgi:hypothetical protein
MILKTKVMKLEEHSVKLQRKITWCNFEERRKLLGQNIKEKIHKYLTVASQRNRKIETMIRSTPNNIRNEIMMKEEEARKRRMFLENMAAMTSSMEENGVGKSLYLSQEKIFIEWWHNKFEKEEKMIKQFENDNIFYIDKIIWNEIKREKICLKHVGKIINQEDYKCAKIMIRKGV